MNNSIFNIENYNNDFLIITSEDKMKLSLLGKHFFINKLNFIEEVIVTEIELCLKLNESFIPENIDQLLQEFKSNHVNGKGIYKLPVYFNNHLDWNNVKEHTGNTKKEIIDHLISKEFNVAMFGFMPGFIYLNGLPKSLQVPRKNIPSKYIEENSLAIGGKYLGIYSVGSPGGWHVLGRLPITVFNKNKLPPVFFNVNDVICLESISEEKYNALKMKNISIQEYNS